MCICSGTVGHCAMCMCVCERERERVRERKREKERERERKRERDWHHTVKLSGERRRESLPLPTAGSLQCRAIYPVGLTIEHPPSGQRHCGRFRRR